MGCGSVSKQPPRSTLTEEEQEVIRFAKDFRAKIVHEVTLLSERHSTSDDPGSPQMHSTKSLLQSSVSCTSAVGRTQSGGSSFGMRNSCPTLSRCASSNRNSTSSTPSRPLKCSFHKSKTCTSSLVNDPHLQDHMAGIMPGSATIHNSISSQNAGWTGTHMIMKTRKVHKHKHYAKKVYAQRRLGSQAEEQRQVDDSVQDNVNKLPEEDKKQLMKSVQRHFLFSSLSKSELQMLLDEMVYQENKEGDLIVEKGQKGDACYMIISGICAAEKNGLTIAQFSAGDLVGELAMLYDVPRTANVICKSSRLVLGVIRGHTFRRSLAIAREKSLSTTLDFLNNHKIFSKLMLDEKRMLASALNFETFEPGALLISDSMSHTTELMFLVQEGSIDVQDSYKNHNEVGVGATICGQNMPYGNPVVVAKALSHVRCLSIAYSVMNRLFGNIREVLRISTVRAFLEPLSFFRQLTDHQQSIAAGCFQEQKVSKGDIIVSALSDPQLVVVMEGEVSMTERQESAVVPVKTAGDIPSCGDPEMEIPPAEPPQDSDCKESDPHPLQAPMIHVDREVRRLHRGDLFGQETFREDARMQYSLSACTEGMVCRAGHQEICRALRGKCEETPKMSWILLRNQVKKILQGIFPFSSLYDEMLDIVVEAFEFIEHPPSAQIMKVDEDSQTFFIIVEGEAMIRYTDRAESAALQQMERWATFGASQMLLGLKVDADIFAAASGCSIWSLSVEAFFSAVGVLYDELQTRMIHQDLKITLVDLTVEDTLGKGQFGTVRRVFIRDGFDNASQGYALKTMSKKRIIDLEQSAACKLEREILHECCHPLIVRLVTSFQDEINVHLLMETLSGGDLFTAFREIGSLSEDHTLFYSASIVLGLEYIHSRRIVYRDLKPENIMLTGDGFVKIVDFGCCMRKYRSYTFIGTPEYLAPEVILGKGYGKAVDWWSLGIIMYEMICGPLPFGDTCTEPLGVMKEILEKELVFPAQMRGEGCEEILTALLERMPEQRLGSSNAQWRSEVREHPFFEDLQWDAILEQSTPPPYVPSHDKDNNWAPTPTTLSVGSEASMASMLSGEFDHDGPPDPGADLSFFEGF